MSKLLRSFQLCTILCVYSFSLALAQDDTQQFIYKGFKEVPMQLFGAYVQQNGLLLLTNTTDLKQGKAFHKAPIRFSPDTFSFSTNFVFAIIPPVGGSGGFGLAFVISPTVDFQIVNVSQNGDPSNHMFAIELDTVQNPEFNDIDGNHVGIDVNSVASAMAASAAYFSDSERKNISLRLESGEPMQLWIEYNGTEKLIHVTLAPTGIRKPSRPLLSYSIDLSQILLTTSYAGFTAATGTRPSEHVILGWSFNGTGLAEDLDINDLPSLPETPGSRVRRKSSEHTEQIIIVFSVVAFLVVIAIGGTVYLVRKKRYDEVYEDWEREYGPQRFSYKDLYKATKGFRDKEVIGKGGFGKVYRGVLPSSNLEIAVKRISHDSKQGMKEFVTEIASMGRLRHRNLVQLRGYCRRRRELLLVYDYMPNGSLDKYLYTYSDLQLDWFQRFRIIRDVASGLLYLHEEWEQVVLHRDIKPGNVLLDADLNGRLGDFGLARLHDHGGHLHTTKVVGTFGYIAPELPITGKASTSTDVYAFGIFMLEVASGMRATELRPHVIDCWRNGAIINASDPRLKGAYAEDQMELVLKLGLFCSQSNPAARPTMRQVMQFLDGDAKLPELTSDQLIDFLSAFDKYSESMSIPVLAYSSSQAMSSTTTKGESSSSQTMCETPLVGSTSQIICTTDSILIEGR